MTETIVETTCDVLGKVKQGVDNDNGPIKANLYLAGTPGMPGNPVLQAMDSVGTLWQLVLWVEDPGNVCADRELQ